MKENNTVELMGSAEAEAFQTGVTTDEGRAFLPPRPP